MEGNKEQTNSLKRKYTARIPRSMEPPQDLEDQNETLNLSLHPSYFIPNLSYNTTLPSNSNSAVPQRFKQKMPRRKPPQKEAEAATVPTMYPWGTGRPALVHPMKYLLENEITTISDQMQCSNCNKSFSHEYDLSQTFQKIQIFINKLDCGMHNRAPEEWTKPALMACKFCDNQSCKPLIPDNKDAINWLFLFLGGWIGCCTLEQLKYFCQHRKIHRTGAKDRLIYSVNLELCKQLSSV